MIHKNPGGFRVSQVHGIWPGRSVGRKRSIGRFVASVSPFTVLSKGISDLATGLVKFKLWTFTPAAENKEGAFEMKAHRTANVVFQYGRKNQWQLAVTLSAGVIARDLKPGVPAEGFKPHLEFYINFGPLELPKGQGPEVRHLAREAYRHLWTELLFEIFCQSKLKLGMRETNGDHAFFGRMEFQSPDQAAERLTETLEGVVKKFFQVIDALVASS